MVHKLNQDGESLYRLVDESVSSRNEELKKLLDQKKISPFEI